MPQNRLAAMLKIDTTCIAAGLVLVCMLLAACAGKGDSAARRDLAAFKVTPNMTVYLPAGWRAEDPAAYGAAIDALRAQISLPISRPDALFSATRPNADGEPAAMLTIGWGDAAGLNNDTLSALTAEEKQQLAQATVLVMQGISAQTGIPFSINGASFKEVGRYEPMLISGKSKNLITFDSAFYFLSGNALALNYVHLSNTGDAVDPAAEFARILAAFEPDAAYRPAPPPARTPGELMPQYLLRAGYHGGQP